MVAPAAMLAVGGVTAIDDRVFAAAFTVSAACAVNPLAEAVIVVEPAPTAVARPDALMVATVVLDEDHVMPVVSGAVVPLLYVAVTLNCWVAPAVAVADGGVTAMAVTVAAAAVTVSVFVPLTPLIAAVTVALPALAPVATPAEVTEATAVLELLHVTDEVMLAVLPSL